FTLWTETLRPGESAPRESAMPHGGAAPQNWKRKAGTFKCWTSQATLQPSLGAATSTLETLRATLRCAPEAVIFAPAKSGGARNWTPLAATSLSLMPEATSAYAPAADKSISARCAARYTPRPAEAGFASCTFPAQWSWNRAAAAFA